MAIPQNRKRLRANEDWQDGHRTKAQKTHSSLLDKCSASTSPQGKTAPGSSPAWQYPPEFWDRLSTIPLIRSALEELDRRNRARPASPARPLSPTGPTRDLARFARHGGPDLRDLRGYSTPVARQDKSAGAMASPQPSSSRVTKSTDLTIITKSGTTKTKKFSTYNPGFDQHLTDYNIRIIWDSEEPELDAVYATLAKPRPSLSPSQFSNSAFKTFRKTFAQAEDENDVMNYVVPIITGPREANYPSTSSMVFGNLEPLTDGTIAAPRPDIALGALPEQLHPTIRNKLQHHLIPSPATHRLMAPNFFIEAKGPDGSAAVMLRQARYDGAVGARAMHSLQNYGREKPVYDGNAYTYSSTFHNGQLQLYAHHITAPAIEGARPEYHMTQLRGFTMTDTRETFVEGATAFRNLRDLAKQHRDTFIEDANARYQAEIAAAPESSPVIAEARSEHDSSSEEFVDCEPYSPPQATSRLPHADEQESHQAESQKSTSTFTATVPAASATTGFISSLPSGKGYNRGPTLSKRNRDSQSPPSGSHRSKRHG